MVCFVGNFFNTPVYSAALWLSRKYQIAKTCCYNLLYALHW